MWWKYVFGYSLVINDLFVDLKKMDLVKSSFEFLVIVGCVGLIFFGVYRVLYVIGLFWGSCYWLVFD